MLKLTIPEFWPNEFSDSVKIIYAIAHFNSVFENAVNNVGNYVDIRVSFPSLNSENQCNTIIEHIRERGDISLSQISSLPDNSFRLTSEYSAEMLWEIEI